MVNTYTRSIIMAVAARRLRQKRVDRYVGEWKNQLRHGYGVYTYENQFFQYEGQWENGLKHGHGKLTLGDGGHYEGAFVRGEIEGHGYRVYGLSGSTYSGQFHRGELHGQGLLRTASGGQYEGSWVYGKKEGSGILTEADASEYEGEFHDNKRHGEGIQTYANGDQYEGDWVAGNRHGQGILRCTDGTIYDGQWRGGVYHGQGSILHSSGVTYKGVWTNGRPAAEVVALRLENTLGESNEIIIEQGKKFNVHFTCVDAKGEPVVSESGRSFKVTAAIQKQPTPRRTKSRMQVGLPPTISEIPSAAIQTPFGYSVRAYELLQVPVPDSSASTSATASRPGTTISEGEHNNPRREPSPPHPAQEGQQQSGALIATCKTDVQDHNAEEDLLHSSSTHELHPRPSTSVDQQYGTTLCPPQNFALSRPETKSLGDMKKHPDKTMTNKEEAFLASLVVPSVAQTSKGRGEFKELFLPPPPLPDISHILYTSPSKRTQTPSPSKESSDNKKQTRKSPGSSQSSTPVHDPSSSSLSSHSKKNLTQGVSSTKLKKTSPKSNSPTKLSEKQKLLQPSRERFCLPGSYVLIVSEVTDPLFLGTRVPDLFVQVKVVSQKATKEVSLDKLLRRSKSKMQQRK